MPPAGFNPITVADERGRGPCVEDARCADCSAADVSWASSNLGVLLCTACAGCHRARHTRDTTQAHRTQRVS